jgi:hypothetical protein
MNNESESINKMYRLRSYEKLFTTDHLVAFL